MAVGATVLLTNGSSVDGVSAATASVTTTAEPTLLWISLAQATTDGNPGVPTVTSTGKTWAMATLGSQEWRTTTTDGVLFCFIGTGAGGTGGITITKNAGDTILTGFAWSVIQLTGVAAAPVLQLAKAQDLDWDIAQTISATLGNAPVATSRCFAASVINQAADNQVERASWTELTNFSSGGSPAMNLLTQWSDTTDQTGSVSQSNANNLQGGLIVIEVGVQTIVPHFFATVVGV